jgi:hypothetical protein
MGNKGAGGVVSDDMPACRFGRTIAECPVPCSGGRFNAGGSGMFIFGIEDTGGFGMLESFPIVA